MTKFPDRLRAARKETGYTQEWMAQQMRIHRTTYTKYETGVTEPSMECLLRIIKLLDINPMELLE